jgi:hypothetical protein
MQASTESELTGSTVIWAIMAVTGLWLAGLFAVAIGYTLFECIGPCTEPSPSWVWWASVVIAGLLFAMSGRVAARMTGIAWTWISAVPGIVFLVLVGL